MAEEFSFELYGKDNAKLETVKNNAEGKFAFTAIPGDKAGVYTYTAPAPEPEPEPKPTPAPENPKTGDGTPIRLLVPMMLVSGACLVGLVTGYKKKEQ